MILPLFRASAKQDALLLCRMPTDFTADRALISAIALQGAALAGGWLGKLNAPALLVLSSCLTGASHAARATTPAPTAGVKKAICARNMAPSLSRPWDGKPACEADLSERRKADALISDRPMTPQHLLPNLNPCLLRTTPHHRQLINSNRGNTHFEKTGHMARTASLGTQSGTYLTLNLKSNM